MNCSASEWPHVNLDDSSMVVARLKGRSANRQAFTHQIQEREKRLLSRLRSAVRSDMGNAAQSLFYSERKRPLGQRAVQALIRRAGEWAGLPVPTTLHMLRHSCGFYLVNEDWNLRQIQYWLGHKRISSTEIYTEIDPTKLPSTEF